MGLENSKIRKIIMVEHEGLRITLRAIDSLLDKVAHGDAKSQAGAHEQVKAFMDAFLQHIEHEERILRPVLKEIDAWGPARIASMDEEHTHQRGQIAHLAGLNPGVDSAAWVREIRAFTKELLIDMADEEKTCLSPNVLRDDIVAVDGASE